jgi:protein-disulfide isomerase
VEAGVQDTIAFARCMTAPATKQRVDADVAVARELKLQGTPAIMVNSTLLPLGLSDTAMVRLINERLSSAPRQ